MHPKVVRNVENSPEIKSIQTSIALLKVNTWLFCRFNKDIHVPISYNICYILNSMIVVQIKQCEIDRNPILFVLFLKKNSVNKPTSILLYP